MTTEERLANLELKVLQMRRRNRWLFVVILLLAGGFIIPGALEMTAAHIRTQVDGTGKEIRARRVVLEDELGNSRVVLDGSQVGLFLSVTSAIGLPSIGLAVTDDGPVLAMHDKFGRGRALLFADKTGPNLKLFNESGDVIWSAVR